MTDAAARAHLASEEHFERWWKHHPIHRQAVHPILVASYREVAHTAWQASAGMITPSHRDERIERLERRAHHLKTRIFNNHPDHSAHDKAELSALEWAIPIVIRATDAAAVPDNALSK